MKNQKTVKTSILLVLALLLAVLATSALAQSGDGGETAVLNDVELPVRDPENFNNFEVIKVERLPSGVTQTTAYIYADRVSFISSGNPTTNYGTWYDVYFGNQSGANEYGAMRMFFHFPVEQIPGNANITYSEFNLYMKSVSETQTRKYNAYTLGSNWSETGLTWANQPGRSSTAAWNADMSNTPGWHVTNATTLTRDWYYNQGGNNGIEIEGEESGDHTRVYNANHSVNAPYLKVTYTTNSQPPAAWITDIAPYVNVDGTNWTTSHFNIAWDSTDYSGTGIKWYDFYYTSNNGSNWTVGQAQVTHKSTPFGPLTHNATYGFYVRARDNSNLEGAAPSGSGSIQKIVRIDGQAPIVAIQDLPEHSDGTAQLNWTGGTDSGTGIQNYDVQWREAGGNWADLFTGTSLTSYLATGGTHGTTYEFRARGRDMVGNVPDWSAVKVVRTTVWSEPIAHIVGFNPSPIYTATMPAIGDNFQVLWQGDAGPDASIDAFALRYQKPGNSTWFTWHASIGTTFDDFVLDISDPDGIYIFQVKAQDSNGVWGQYHDETQGTIIVDRLDPRMTDNVIYLPIIMK